MSEQCESKGLNRFQQSEENSYMTRRFANLFVLSFALCSLLSFPLKGKKTEKTAAAQQSEHWVPCFNDTAAKAETTRALAEKKTQHKVEVHLVFFFFCGWFVGCFAGCMHGAYI